MKEEKDRETQEQGASPYREKGKDRTEDRKSKKKDKKGRKKEKKEKKKSAHGLSSSEGKKSAARTKAVQGRSKRIASVDTDLCYGCGKCVKVCKVKAISLIPRT